MSQRKVEGLDRDYLVQRGKGKCQSVARTIVRDCHLQVVADIDPGLQELAAPLEASACAVRRDNVGDGRVDGQRILDVRREGSGRRWRVELGSADAGQCHA